MKSESQIDDGGLEDAIDSLVDGLRGTVISPDDGAYDDARAVWNGLVDAHPALVVRCQGAADIAKAMQFARERELPFSIRGGGHHQSGSAVVEDGVVLDLSEMNGVHVDPTEQVARVEPGCRARDVLLEAQHYGLATPTGSAGDVGIAGSTLGGGIGWMRRAHGLGIDALRSVDLVTPDGELRRASPDRNEDLFWAIRGGGGNVGVVTSFEFDLYEVGPVVAGLGVFYPTDDAEHVLERYHELTRDAPREVTTLALHSHVPHLPPIPDELAGTDAVAIMGCFVGDVDRGQEALQPFRELAEPLLDMSEPMPYLQLHELGSLLFPEGRNYCHRSAFVDDLDGDVLEFVVEHAADAPSPLSGIGIWHLGGAIADVASDETAFPHRESEYMLTVEANWEDGDSDEYGSDDDNLAWARAGDDALRALGGVGAYGGFTGVSEQAGESHHERVYGENLERLARVKAASDADNVLDQNVNVAPDDD
ncbi:FAD-binding oxidoreductase [Halobacteria archaeon AArc-m2/3/4]|uniref:FAD-binding oxidoreductase n=1 Tax=Natronoglomus mannanivorans TaxID=2979990 RepID=A0ABT2Q9H3_9EURY|nr:FAD-binding oxidoreductase [Halobacteria archaeon AArc-m2/3/4]